MIRVLHVTPKMDFGGVASVVRNYYGALDHDEIRFDFVTHGSKEEYHSELIKEGSNFFYFKTIGQIGLFGYKRQITEHIKIEEYDIIHIHVGDLTGIYAWIFRKCGAKRIINHGHGSKPVSANRKYIESLLRFLARKEADVCIGCGKAAGDFMFGKGNYVLIPNGINYNQFSNPDKSIIKALREQYDINGHPVITNVGNLLPVKNQLFLIEVMRKLIKHYPNALLLLVGEGPERKIIESNIKGYNLETNIRLTGTITSIPELLSMTDIFVLPSLHEGIPVSAIEAQATGTPCVFSKNIDHDIDIGNNNIYFLPIDKGSAVWVEKMIDIFKCDSKIDDINIIHNKLICSGYDIIENAGKLMSIYNKLVN